MISQYFKQAWHQARTNVTYTVLYIIGVTLAMLFTMVMAMVLYVKMAPVYPEYGRANTYYINQVMFKADRMSMINSIGQKLYDDYISKLENAECTAMIKDGHHDFVQPADGSVDFEISMKHVRGDFFKMYDFDFLAGAPFAPEDAMAEIPDKAIITDVMADRLFGGADEAMGKTVTVDRYGYTVVGVVKAPSILTSESYAQLYRPMGKEFGQNGIQAFLGVGHVVIKVADDFAAEALSKEVKDLEARLNSSVLADIDGQKWTVDFRQQPIRHWQNVLVGGDEGNSGALNKIVWLYVVIIMVLLIVPAINLSGLIGGRMDTRLSELGIRKTYGAPRSWLMRQVIFENLLLTLCGAVLGMIGAWILVAGCRRWIFSIFDMHPADIPDWADVAVNTDMLFAPALFVIMLLLCLTVNLLSAIVPAWLYMRKPIVSSLYEKR